MHQRRIDMNQNKGMLFVLTAVLFILPHIGKSQTLSGRVVDETKAKGIAYATVDIYESKNRKASLLTDIEGYFSLTLYPGIYRLEITYAGYTKLVKSVHINLDSSILFKLKENITRKYVEELLDEATELDEDTEDVALMSVRTSKLEKHRTRITSTRMSRAPKVGIMDFEGSGKSMVENLPGPGKLTAGEINDFSKWDLWTDIKHDELNQFQKMWDFSPEGRYLVQVVDPRGLPLADVIVHLVNAQSKKLFSARTDNTGKAELWSSLAPSDELTSAKMSLQADYFGRSSTIRRAKEFGHGVNVFELDVDCRQSQNVDIAFVVDATGSMGDELEYLKNELNDVMYKAKGIDNTLNFNFASVFYRDHTDAYLTRVQNFTRILSESTSFITTQSAGGGGDFEEAVEVALDTAINSLTWSEVARTRVIFLILDAPPHNNMEVKQKIDSLSRQAASQGIRIVPLVASGINKSTEYLMRSIALATNGTYAFLTDHSGIGSPHLAPSTDDFKTETLNDLLVRVIKSYAYMPDCKQKLPELNLKYADSVVSFLSTDSSFIDSQITDSIKKPVEITWKYFPNPTRGIVNIQASAAIRELYITDLSGKVLKIVKDIEREVPVEVDLGEYASGIYLIRYAVEENWISGKVILIR